MEVSTVDIYLFETIERISRFFIHLEDIDKQFYSNEKNILLDKKTFISSYEDCLEKLIELIIFINSEYNKNTKHEPNEQKFLTELESINITIKDLQSKLLIHLPRPTEPVELRRFCRVIYKQIIKLDEKNKDRISIYVNESSQDSVYLSDPLEVFKQYDINSLIRSVQKLNPKKEKIPQLQLSSTKSSSKTIHISIPRIEATNPCHWPTLIHEVSHNLMKDEWFNGQGIVSDFLSFLKKSKILESATFVDFMRQINLQSWLIECWCDLFACALIGPSFFFSQYSVFTHSLEFNNNKKYPPKLFRIKLLNKFLHHRFKNLSGDTEFSKLLMESEKIIQLIDTKNNKFSFDKEPMLVTIFMLFNQYFLYEFFILNQGLLKFKNKELSVLFENISQFVNSFDLEKLTKMSDSLAQGFPIASYRVPSSKNPLFEKPTYVQEIFLASWMYRNSCFRVKILEQIRKLKTKKELLYSFKNNIVKEFWRLDQSILRSIQISEWVDLYTEPEAETTDLKNRYKQSVSDSASQLLVDRDIYQKLKSQEIKIMPLINIGKQLGPTSLDIRLGTSFEVFFPNQFGIVDFTDKDTLRNMQYNSKKINLDYLEHIPINPGQFMLGHSMEYIKLPNQISADLEGRSSFARLGIEIHMTAGFVDPGFEGVLTFEIFNAGTNPVMLYPGLRIGQLRFMKISKPYQDYSSRRNPKYSGMLEHHFSLHGEDYEVNKISLEKNKHKEKNSQ